MDKVSLPPRFNPDGRSGRRSATVLLLALFSMLVCCRRGDTQDKQSQTSDCLNASRPTYQFPFLRFDEDWSLLRCSPRRDRWDRIKYIPGLFGGPLHRARNAAQSPRLCRSGTGQRPGPNSFSHSAPCPQVCPVHRAPNPRAMSKGFHHVRCSWPAAGRIRIHHGSHP